MGRGQLRFGGNCTMPPDLQQLSVELFSENSSPITKKVLDIAIGDWILVEYERKLYPGEVTQLCDNDNLVNAMEPTETGQYKWPLRKDILLYKRSDAKKKISGPIPSHSRISQFHFTEIN
ncbi:hypothetical protein PR048_011276 [Dryococelus australis]|uniref:Uncharacterized protein n=1 Tax=Dryococelus australis TaxID=614101 RepID=A0ABQ9HLB3_9NEOP|nr:hypothetical protein PR048_011276 [Dryococelus australis]